MVDLCGDSDDSFDDVSDDGAPSEDDVEDFKNAEKLAWSVLSQGHEIDEIEDDFPEDVMQAPTYPDLPHFRCIEEIQRFTDIDFRQFRAEASNVIQAYEARKKKRKGEIPLEFA
jgi:hypothetical protein